MPKTLLTTFWQQVTVWLPGVSPGGSRSSWNGCSQRHWLQANGRIGEDLTEREEIQSPRNPIAPRTCSLILLFVHPTVCRSTLVTLKYRECHWPLRKQANNFRQNKSHRAATQQAQDHPLEPTGEQSTEPEPTRHEWSGDSTQTHTQQQITWNTWHRNGNVKSSWRRSDTHMEAVC